MRTKKHELHHKRLSLLTTTSLAVLISMAGASCSSGESTNGGNVGNSNDAPPPDSNTGGAETAPDQAPSGNSNQVDPGVNAARFNDTFDQNSLASWSLRHVVEQTPAQYTLLDINQTTPSALTLVPTQTPGWFANGDAPLVFKLISGNFSVQTEVTAQSNQTPGLPPSEDFNSAGLMARNPAGATENENHIMVNVGRQNDSLDNGIGSETKTTRNSNSQLTLQNGSNSGRLILCRVGNAFLAYRMLDNEAAWTEIGSTTRNDLPETLQVGMVANGFNGPDLRATFTEISMSVPASESDCTP